MPQSDLSGLQHLRLDRWIEPAPRRKRPGFPGSAPARGNRTDFAEEIIGEIDELVAMASKKPLSEGVDPKLIFRIGLAEGASIESIVAALEASDLHVVQVDKDSRIVVAFRDSLELDSFRAGVARYAAGPTIKPDGSLAKSTTWDFLEFFEPSELRPWGRDDRIGPFLARRIGSSGNNVVDEAAYYVDIDLWNRGPGLTESGLVDIAATMGHEAQNCRILDRVFYGDIDRVRAVVPGSVLSRLLELDVIAKVDERPNPRIDAFEMSLETTEQFDEPAAPDEDGPTLCILDTGVSFNHPLLRRNIIDRRSFIDGLDDSGDSNGHGTAVASIAVHGDVFSCYRDRNFTSPIRLLSAKVINDSGDFDPARLVETQLIEVIETYTAEPFGCKVFNLSLNMAFPGAAAVLRQGPIGALLDALSRDYQVLFVVSAGNQYIAEADNTADSYALKAGYPGFLLDDRCRIADPGGSCISVTVGSVAQFTAPDALPALQDITFDPVAKIDQPSPFTRTGPGVNGAVKPDFVDYGGNMAITGVSPNHRLSFDNLEKGIAVQCLSNTPLSALFSFMIGTSLAAPRVARSAAILWDALQKNYDFDVHPNLVRALLASSAELPLASLEVVPDLGEIRRYCGYGQIDMQRAAYSRSNAVTMFVQDVVEPDSFLLYEIPMPDEFLRAPSSKRLSISFAYDPPTRRGRSEYVGVDASFYLVRSGSPELIISALKSLSAEERAAREEGSVPKVGLTDLPIWNLSPGVTERGNSTLQKASVTAGQRLSNQFGETYYLAVSLARRPWAQDVASQGFAAAVVLESESEMLYTALSQRLQLAPAIRLRV